MRNLVERESDWCEPRKFDPDLRKPTLVRLFNRMALGLPCAGHVEVRNGETCRLMLFEGSARQVFVKRFVPATAAGMSLLLAAVVLPANAGILDPLNPFASGNTGPVTPEEKARRDQARTELYDRLSPGYGMSVPFV